MNDFYQDLAGEFEKRIEPLQQKQSELEKEKGELSVSPQDLKLYEARTAVLQRKAEQALVEGNSEVADDAQADIRDLKTGFGQKATRLKEIEDQLTDLDAKVKELGKAVLRDKYPEIQKQCHDQMEKSVEMLDSAWSDLQAYSRESGAEVSYGRHFELLRLRPLEPTAKLRQRLERWL